MNTGNTNDKNTSSENPNCTECKKGICNCMNQKCTYAYKQYGLKKWVYRIIIIVISMGLIVPFLSEVICTIWFPNATLGLNVWNQFVSIILGIVATTLSIVSMIMGFKSYEDGLELHDKNVEMLMDIANISTKVENVEKAIRDLGNTKKEVQGIIQDQEWRNDPEN